MAVDLEPAAIRSQVSQCDIHPSRKNNQFLLNQLADEGFQFGFDFALRRAGERFLAVQNTYLGRKQRSLSDTSFLVTANNGEGPRVLRVVEDEFCK